MRHTFPLRLHAHTPALLQGFEPVSVTLAASVPEPVATSVVDAVVEPFDCELTTRTIVLRQRTCLC